ncbi:MAG: polysaccharide biosynthesis protein [Fidelibacterota bacterium]|nr:MAG: polysaccharide biosynthesis protein [Candidatus Neomarinimicrobiota bacterium]
MLQPIKALSLQTLIYGTGHILVRSVSFMLLPLYTNVFSTYDYGVISLAYAFMGFMGVVLKYGLDAALMKWYVQTGGEDRARYLTTAYYSFVITTAVFIALLLAFRQPLAAVLLGGDHPRFIAYISGILFFDVLWYVPLLLLRSEERPLVYTGFSLLNVAGSLGLNLLLVLKYRMGIQGVLMSNLITSGSLFVLTFPIIWKRLELRRASLITWRQLMRFGLPFLPSGIFAMTMELANRYILKIMTDVETVGIYSAGHKLGMLMFLIAMGFNMSWHPFFLKQEDTDETRRLFARIATYLLAVLGFIWVLMCLWVPHLVRLDLGPVTFYGPDFWQGTEIVPWIALGYLFHAAYLLQLPGVFQLESSLWVAITRGIGALSNVVLNVALIPLYGALGAALATCLSFLIMALAFLGINQRIYPVPYEWSRLLRVFLLMAGIYGLWEITEGAVLRDVLLMVSYPIVLVLTGFLNVRERAVIARIFRVSRAGD